MDKLLPLIVTVIVPPRLSVSLSHVPVHVPTISAGIALTQRIDPNAFAQGLYRLIAGVAVTNPI